MKKTIIVANATFDAISTPYQRIRIGASAIFGTALVKIRKGENTPYLAILCVECLGKTYGIGLKKGGGVFKSN